MLLLLCGDKKTRSQRSLRRYCCQRCAITSCSSVYEAALLGWLIGFYLQKLFGLSPHTVYDEPVAWNDFGCPGWPPFSQEWHGFGLGAGHKKSRVQPAPGLQASVHASAGRPCMSSVFSGGCFMIFHTSMRNIHTSNKNDIMMLLGLKMIYSIQFTIIRIHIIYYTNISSTIASHDLGITIECVIGNCFEVESIRQQVKFSDEVSNSDDVAGSTRWPCRGGKRQTKLMIHRWSTLHDMMYIYLEYQLDVFFLGCSCFWSKTKNFWKTHFWCHIVVLWCCFFVLWCRVFGCVSPLLACVMFLVETKKKTSNGGPGIYTL